MQTANPINLLLPPSPVLSNTIQDTIRQELVELNGFAFSEVAENAASPWEWIGKADLHTAYILLVEAHCEFENMTKLVTLLESTALHNASAGCIIFVSDRFDSMTPELDSVTDSEDSQCLLNNLRHSQFYLRMLASYGWAQYCHTAQLADLLCRISSQPLSYLLLTEKSRSDWADDVARIKTALEARLCQGVWANTTQPDYPDWRPNKKHAEQSFEGILNNPLEAMALAHLFGRIDSPNAEKLFSNSTIQWFARGGVPPSPPQLRDELQKSTLRARGLWQSSSTRREEHAKTKHATRKSLIRNAALRNATRANLFVFDLLKDLSQMLSRGTAIWASEASASAGPPLTGDRPIPLLAIPDTIRGVAEQTLSNEYFRSAFNAAFRPGTLTLHCIQYDREKSENQPWDTQLWWQNKIDGDLLDVTDHLNSDTPLSSKLLDYDIILIEAEYPNRFVGPSIIQWMDHMLDEAQSTHSLRRPQLIVLSRDENAGHSYICLWLGAQAYASKTRIFSIPSLLTMANVRGQAVELDRKRLRPNFYVLEGLSPHQRNRLHSLRPRDMICGDCWDQHWIQSFPRLTCTTT